ncbi:unnamed protein product [Alopecurus aequalis]
MITQCPLRPGGNYTYSFNVTGQEGTLWWHAHNSFLRATVYGALVILPRSSYPFPKPDKEEIVMLGEWWNANVFDLQIMAFLTGLPARQADAYTINGKPGDLYNCSALNLFFKVANHSFTVVAVDACYTTPYESDVVVIAPGQTVDALMVTDAAVGRYYMAASPYDSAIPAGPPFTRTAATGVLEYVGAPNTTSPPALPPLPELRDTDTAHKFLSNLAALVLPGKPTVPLAVDTRMFVTIGLGVADCLPEQTLCNRSTTVFAASMNNADYTSDASDNATLQYTRKSTRVKTLKYNKTVEMVLQDTRLIAKESHPMHLHGFNFFVLAQSFGNYDETTAVPQFNLVNPQERNTIAVPTVGWAVIRFVADNPGIWYMHCHFEAHLDFGLGMIFEVQDGPSPDTSVPSPPEDLPQCG